MPTLCDVNVDAFLLTGVSMVWFPVLLMEARG